MHTFCIVFKINDAISFSVFLSKLILLLNMSILPYQYDYLKSKGGEIFFLNFPMVTKLWKF